jgi:hypothetical protein
MRVRSAAAAASVVFAALTLAASTSEAKPRSRRAVTWPDPLVVSLSGTVGPMSWGQVEFVAPYVPGLQMSGDALELDRVSLTGAGFEMAFVGEWVTFAIGMDYGTSRQDRGRPVSIYGISPTLVRLHVFQWSADAGLSHRFGELTLFLVAHGAWARALLELEDPSILLRGLRPALGPKIGLRAQLRGSLFVQASFFTDMVTFPDHRIIVGLGVGRR